MADQPVIAYTQKTWKLNSGEPMHAENGYWRPKPDGSIEVVIPQSTGLVEVQVFLHILLCLNYKDHSHSGSQSC